jgi:acyl-CoA synthetase (AMP-forming)/AMP-acid ligase II
VVCTTPDAELDEAAVIAHCRQSLAGYKVPKRVDFRDELPKNASMKVLKTTLRDEHTQAPVQVEG